MAERRYFLPEQITISSSHSLSREVEQILVHDRACTDLVIDGKNLIRAGSILSVLQDEWKVLAAKKKINLLFDNYPAEILAFLSHFEKKAGPSSPAAGRTGFFEDYGERMNQTLASLGQITIFLSNVYYWSFKAFFIRKTRRKGEIVRQSVLIGLNAIPIIALIAFLIGLILALQSAAQLRQFGANIFVADLVAIAMVSEMGPLITAVMVAGRSGSAIAAEIATMVVSEEIDALEVMGIDPIPYLIVPRIYAMILVVPLLTVLANVLGIFGGLVIGLTYLDLNVAPFMNEVLSVLRLKEIGIAMLKSFSFASIIVLTASYLGLQARGGSEEVGRATTATVVVSIFLIIVIDSIIGLLFYFG